jgi:hypothetical protein
MKIYPQQSLGLIYFDKDTKEFISGTGMQTHIGQQFVDFFRHIVAGLDFSGYSFVSAYNGIGEVPKILNSYIEAGDDEHVVELGPTLLYTNDDGQGNFYDRYAAVAVVRGIDFTIPAAQAGMEFSESVIKKVEFMIECYHGGIRPGQSQNFALLFNGHVHGITTHSLNMREKEVVKLSIPISEVHFRQENIAVVYVLPWQEDGPKSTKTGKGPVHFRDVGIINAYFRVRGK